MTEEQIMVRDMARDFAANELLPIASMLDEEGKFPAEIIKKMGDLGLMGMAIPEEYGGAGLDAISYALAMEEIARGCAGTSVIMSVNNSLACDPIYKFGKEDQKRKYLVPLAKGEKLGCFCLTEPMSGSDAAAMRASAELKGDSWVLNGTKSFVTNGAHADVCIVFAQADKTKGHRGINAFIVEKSSPGLRIGKIEKKLGINASDTAELIFEDCRAPAENLLGEPGIGFRIALSALDSGRIGIAAQALGIARAGFEESLKYSKERSQFGQKISEFQAIQWKLADMATEIEAARLLVLRAAYLKDKGQRFTVESAMAKLYASEMAMRATTNAIQIHGGYGYIKEYPVERHFRDAKITEIYEGTSEVQRLLIANSVLSWQL